MRRGTSKMDDVKLTKKSEISAALATELSDQMDALRAATAGRVTYKDMSTVLSCTPTLLSLIDSWSSWMHIVEKSELGRLIIKYIKNNTYTNFSQSYDVLIDFVIRGDHFLEHLTINEFFSHPLVDTIEHLHRDWMYVHKSTMKLIAILHYCYYIQHRYGDQFFITHSEQVVIDIANILQSNLSSGNPHLAVARSCVEALRQKRRSVAEEHLQSDICHVLHSINSIVDEEFRSLGFIKLSDNPTQTRYRCLQNNSVSTVKYNNHSSHYLHKIQASLLQYLKCREVENGGTMTDDVLVEIEGDLLALVQLVGNMRQPEGGDNHANT